MKYIITKAVLSASTLLLSTRHTVADPVAAPEPVPTTLALKTMSKKGCYSSSQGFTDQGSWTYQSSGYCQQLCVGKGFPVMALWKGSDCLCGNALPPDSAQTDNNNCNAPCDGWPQDTCGGNNAYDIYLTGTEDTVSTLPSGPTTTTSGDAGGPTGAPVVVTQAGATVVVTASSQTNSSSSQSKSSGPNIAGIAAGVVVGVGVLGIIIGSAFFLIRRQKRKAVEREYRRNAAISFAPSKTASTGSMNNSRWDGEYMAQRRQSNGSIAEDEDFSRRILKVTNPDR
ncbi:hypothetical protein Egran_03064 [Elaphomyces granulatus]|uniref:WSC domain-containing protein n=1 Tax=Elaphomyces granulatus TaxID=519963 RepID=A0A232LYF5_9EURO|nr:hypothetical protein Egran_03064 [Elaphomyces granulatus]